MKSSIRQGIISQQLTPSILSVSGNTVSFNAETGNTIITFCYGKHNYLFTETSSVSSAWAGPFSSSTDYWLYWDIDLSSGVRTFGHTMVEPTYGSNRPTSPVTGQHFFDTTTNKMLVFGSNKWSERLRVFAGKLASGSILTVNTNGSQVGLNTQNIVGHLMFSAYGTPFKSLDNDGVSYFLTTETALNVQTTPNNSFDLEKVKAYGKAIEPIPQFSCVTYKGERILGVASSIDSNLCVGIAGESIVLDETKTFITEGFVKNYNNWNFTEAPGTKLWVGSRGEVTTSVPSRFSMQQIGHVVSADTIFVKLEELIYIDRT